MRSNPKAIKINFITIIAVYFLILVGGIVRSMGAGMGCPDWPKCFGEYIPPTSSADLPEDYQDMYLEKRLQKNQRLSGVLDNLGFSQLSKKVLSDTKVTEATFFDVHKAWTEYVNRLIGVVIGFLIVLNTFFAFSYRKEKLSVTLIAVASVILVLFQGWIGSLVVSTNLIPGFISFHMVLAILLVGLLLIQRHWMIDKRKLNVQGRYILITLLILFAIQILLGVQVREQIDLISSTTETLRSTWIGELGTVFYVHRSYSILLVVGIGYLLYINMKKNNMNWLLYALGAVVVAEVVMGAILSYFSMPVLVQPLHLLLATLAFGILFYLYLNTGLKSKY